MYKIKQNGNNLKVVIKLSKRGKLKMFNMKFI